MSAQISGTAALNLFYAHRQVQAEVPEVKSRHDNVPWNDAEAHRLLESADRDERKLGEVMRKGLDGGWGQGVCQVFLLSGAGDPSHVTLAGPIENNRIGKASGFVRRQRYTSVHQLRHAHSVWEL